ncbi:MAG: NUDIX hydrolase [Gammaproteobacteria bacterium]|jgi:ADP-ribose pyrophosphatase YjhB (NUDIX family)|nr:NUDIX hydrolase [Gammaproteobacteria bacterium]
MNYCNQCGAEVIGKIPAGDNRLRYVCVSCEEIHYQNPKIVAGCIPEYEGKVLLCKRAIEPRYGYWTLPAGFMELEETSLEAALRETLEEANARVVISELYAVFNLPNVSQVYMMYRSQLLDLDFSAGEESLEVKLFAENEIPWDDIAFTTIKYTLKFFFQDQRNKEFSLHTGDISNQSDGTYGFRPGPEQEP